MRQKTFSSERPENPFIIENIKNGRCTILFFDNIEEVQEVGEEQEVSTTYKYDQYNMENVPYRDSLSDEIHNNLQDWLEKAKEQDKEIVADKLKEKRDADLYATDWTQIPNSPLSPEVVQKYALYRQALRDVPQQEGFPYDVEYPKLEDYIGG